MPAAAAGQLPSTADQYRALENEIAKSRPAVTEAKRRSEQLNTAVTALRQNLIETASRVQALEQQNAWLSAEVGKLTRDLARLSERFLEQRAAVRMLLAAVERIQHDTPPVMAIRTGDAIGAAHASMLLGATLSRFYGAAAELARRLAALQQARTDLTHRRADAETNAVALAASRAKLDQLLAMKSNEAGEADASYDDLSARLDAAATQAADLDTVLRKAAALRAAGAAHELVAVAAPGARTSGSSAAGGLERPVVGRMVAGDGATSDAPRAPGVSFLALPLAQVIAPADSKVLFAGPYHKMGQILILQTGRGYALVLAGLGRIDVRPGDLLLAGEPVGRMPQSGSETRLYFELRQNGKGFNPAPWLANEPGKVKRS
jgi:septal ring factor EnvC (AmiA/AmiB activator)